MRFESLTGLRAILSVMVVICHGGQRVGWLEGENVLSSVLIGFGHFGVVCFFILSGFILNIVYSGRDWTIREYSVNRFARIYPLYILCVLFTLPIDWFSPGFAPGNKVESLGLTIFMQQSWLEFSNGRFNGPGWTLSVEFLFYALFPVLFWIRTKSAAMLLGVFLTTLAVSIYFWDASDFYRAHRFPPMRVWEFIFGMLLGSFFLSSRRLGYLRGKVPLALSLLGIGAISGHFWPQITGWEFSEWLLMSLCGGGLIFLLAARDQEEGRGSWLSGSVWVLGGEISFGVYLLHDGVQRYSKVALDRIVHVDIVSTGLPIKLGYILATLLVSLVMALFLYRLVEVPSRRFLRKHLSRN